MTDWKDALTEPACWSWPVPSVADIEAWKASAAADPIWARFRVDFLRWHFFHDNRCAICGIRQEQMVDDHDHDTGLMRGRLCRSCNRLEGVGVWHIIQMYRDKNPASILNHRQAYINPRTGRPVPLVAP